MYYKGDFSSFFRKTGIKTHQLYPFLGWSKGGQTSFSSQDFGKMEQNKQAIPKPILLRYHEKYMSRLAKNGNTY